MTIDTTTIIYALVVLFLLSAVIHRIMHKHLITAIIFGLLLAFVVSNWAGIIAVLPI